MNLKNQNKYIWACNGGLLHSAFPPVDLRAACLEMKSRSRPCAAIYTLETHGEPNCQSQKGEGIPIYQPTRRTLKE